MENQSILKRLQEKQANYNVAKWDEEAEGRKKILKQICEYPYLLEQQQIASQSQNNI